jgi:hypothetical protein
VCAPSQPTLVLSLLWQLIKAKIASQVSLSTCPDLVHLQLKTETTEEFEALAVETMLLRWFNHQLFWARSDKSIDNFGR